MYIKFGTHWELREDKQLREYIIHYPVLDTFRVVYYTLLRIKAGVKFLWLNIRSIIEFSNIQSGLPEFRKIEIISTN
jgi:hypothetical protein